MSNLTDSPENPDRVAAFRTTPVSDRFAPATIVPAEDPLARGTCPVCYAAPGNYCAAITEANPNQSDGTWAHLPRIQTRPAFPERWNPMKGERISVQTVDGTVVLGTITNAKKSDDGSQITLTIQGDG